MELIKKIDIFVNDEISTGDVAVNNTKGNIDVVGGSCPDGQIYDKIKKVCVPAKKNEAGAVSAMVAGSGQTRVVGRKDNIMVDLKRKNPIEDDGAIPLDDPTVANLNRMSLRFNTLLGAYVPEEGE